MTEQEARILFLETSVDDLLAGNQRLRDERDQLLGALHHLTTAAVAEVMLLEDGPEVEDIASRKSVPPTVRKLAAAIVGARAALSRQTSGRVEYLEADDQ